MHVKQLSLWRPKNLPCWILSCWICLWESSYSLCRVPHIRGRNTRPISSTHNGKTTWQLIRLKKYTINYTLNLHACMCACVGVGGVVIRVWVGATGARQAAVPHPSSVIGQSTPSSFNRTPSNRDTRARTHSVGGMKPGQLGPDATATMTPANYSTTRQGCVIKSPSNWEKERNGEGEREERARERESEGERERERERERD